MGEIFDDIKALLMRNIYIEKITKPVLKKTGMRHICPEK